MTMTAAGARATGRVLLERGCRMLALTALGWALVRSLRGRDDVVRAAARVTVTLADSVLSDSAGRGVALLRDAVVQQAVGHAGGQARTDTLQLPLSAIPSRPTRAALGAMAAADVPLRWEDRTNARGLAVSLARTASPRAPLDLRVTTGGRGAVVVRDAGGLLDSLAPSATLAWRLASAASPLRVQQGRSTATAMVPERVVPKRLLVVAHPGWEGKFVVAALEEAGWVVDGTLRVSPTGRVTIGAPERLDTARYAAVVIPDSMAVDAAALTAYVRRGGGLVLGGDALRVPALAALRPARALAVRGAIAGALLTDVPRRGLDAWELSPVADAVVLAVDAGDHAHEEPALLARRVGAGRVVAMPYRESWRWRMQGTDDGAAGHRGWWHGAVSAAVSAASPAVSSPAIADALPGDAAPYADLVARAGAAVPATAGAEAGASGAPTRPVGGRDGTGDERRLDGDIPGSPGGSGPVLPLLVALTALLVEWTSRRWRGVR